MRLPVILVFDIGKTNKKVVLFDKQYNLVYEESKPLEETKDEDDFPCEDVHELTAWVHTSFQKIQRDNRFEIAAVNVSAYGASLVHLDYRKQPFLPIYNYLKPYDEALRNQFYTKYGGENKLSEETASPVLGNLNSGMQLYWLKHRKPHLYAQISGSLHLPQYIAFILCGYLCSDITSIGCHTNLWNFKQNNYHRWVYEEGIDKKLAPLFSCTQIAGMVDGDIPVGIGLHDSSAALIPYLSSFNQRFVLLSTGTWSISLNPFNRTPITSDELNHDCLQYLSYTGDSVKASRLFAGYEHEQQTKRLAAHYNTSTDYFKTVVFDVSICKRLPRFEPNHRIENVSTIQQSLFSNRNLAQFNSYEEAYHQLMCDIVKQQVQSTQLVLQNAPVKKIFVDGGFSKNDIYMNLLAAAFPHCEVYAATVAQASALGAAIAIKESWNDEPLPSNLIAVKRYQSVFDLLF